MKYVVTLRVETATDIAVESDTDIDKLSVNEKIKFMESLEDAVMRYYDQSSLDMSKADAVGERAVYLDKLSDEEEEPEIKITLEDWK